MKATLSHMFLLSMFCLFLIFPIYTLNGAASGLLLWYNIVLPTLFPFIVITTLMLKTKAFRLISDILGPCFGRFFLVSNEGSLAIIIGFLCGYPMGAKIINDLYEEHSISLNETKYLLSFCNNTSPMFIVSFFVYQILGETQLLSPTLFALYAAPIIMSFITRYIYLLPVNKIDFHNNSEKRYNKKIEISFQLLDTTIIDSITLILKIGGYIMLFSIFISLSYPLIAYCPLLFYFIPLLEVTNGITMFHTLITSTVSYLLMIFLISFGGVCAIGQTRCVIKSNDIKIFPYFLQKIITAIIAVIISFCMLLINQNIRLL